MKTVSKEQRAMMIAHLCDEASKVVRSGCTLRREVLVRADDVTCALGCDVEEDYRTGLRFAGLGPEQIDAAVSSIERGEWPADSFVGRVEKMRADAARGAASVMCDMESHVRHCAKQEALGNVLALLGVKP